MELWIAHFCDTANEPFRNRPFPAVCTGTLYPPLLIKGSPLFCGVVRDRMAVAV